MADIQNIVFSTSYNLKSTLILLGVVALLTIAYAVRLMLKGRAHFARVDKQGGSALLSKGVMEMGYWWLQPVARSLVAIGVSANAISWTSLFFGFLAGLCLAFGHFGFGGLFALIGGLLDAVDGLVARMTDTVSEAGAILDTTLDRYVEFFFIGGLVIHYRDLPILQVLTLLALMGSFMVSYSSAKAAELRVDPPKGSMRRPERMFYLVLGAVLSPITIAEYEYVRDYPIKLGIPMVIAISLIAVLANASAAERMAAIAKATRIRDLAKRKEAATLAASELGEGSAGTPAQDPARTR